MTRAGAWCLIILLAIAAQPASAKPQPKHIRVIAALCDNQYQGIVPVPEKIGNGDDPVNNLYWGALYGMKTHFKKSPYWSTVSCGKGPIPEILERCVFKHKQSGAVLTADAYRGREIKRATIDFLETAAGGDADLAVYMGHDGLMDFSLPSFPTARDKRHRDVIILACASKQFFTDAIKASGAYPLIWTTNLMAPEAYTLEGALEGYVIGENPEQVRQRAAAAYNKYQKCGEKAAMRLLVTGF